MAFKMKSPENFWSGVLFIGFGVAALVLSRNYPLGTAMQMGAGYFPTLLGGLLVLLGAIISATAFRISGEGIKPFAWRPMVLLSGGFAYFGLTVDRLGFLPALFGLILLCSAAGREFKWLEVLIMTAVLIAGSWVLFIWGLEVPFQLFWWR